MHPLRLQSLQEASTPYVEWIQQQLQHLEKSTQENPKQREILCEGLKRIAQTFFSSSQRRVFPKALKARLVKQRLHKGLNEILTVVRGTSKVIPLPRSGKVLRPDPDGWAKITYKPEDHAAMLAYIQDNFQTTLTLTLKYWNGAQNTPYSLRRR